MVGPEPANVTATNVLFPNAKECQPATQGSVPAVQDETGIHLAYTGIFPATAVFALNAVPPPFIAVNHPAKILFVLEGGVGKVPRVVAGGVTVRLGGVATTVAPWLSKVTVADSTVTVTVYDWDDPSAAVTM